MSSLIDNSFAKLAGGTEFFSRFFIALVLNAAQQRATRRDEQKMPTYFFIDECDTAIARDPNIATIFDRCRSQKIGLVLAHQRLQQIKLEEVKDALANAAVRIVNSDDDAPALAGRMRSTAEHLRSLKRGQFALFMRDLTPSPLIIEVPDDRIDSWPKMESKQAHALRQQQCDLFSYPIQLPMPEPFSEPEPASYAEVAEGGAKAPSPNVGGTDAVEW